MGLLSKYVARQTSSTKDPFRLRNTPSGKGVLELISTGRFFPRSAQNQAESLEMGSTDSYLPNLRMRRWYVLMALRRSIFRNSGQ